MNVLQLIDSLNPGGAERLAVNIANELHHQGVNSHLCATRTEGLLKSQLHKEVGFLSLQRKGQLNPVALQRLLAYINKHDIKIIHAHGTSYFFASQLKILKPKMKLVWHDHYGNSEFLINRPIRVLKLCSRFFNAIISVNEDLKNWAMIQLNVSSISVFPNMVALDKDVTPKTILAGEKNKRVVCLANLRPQKDHHTLINAFSKSLEFFPEWTLHLIGKDFTDSYSSEIVSKIKSTPLKNHIFFYGSRMDIYAILKQADIGVLSSKSEGLPISLLEYGLAQLPVIATDVGACAKVIGQNGIIIDPSNVAQLSEAFNSYMDHPEFRSMHADAFHAQVTAHYTADSYAKKLLELYNIVQHD